MGMKSLEKITASLKLMDFKRNSLRKAVLMVALEWKGLEEHLDSAEKIFEEGLAELESRAETLDSIRKSIAESNEEMELLRKSLESRREELDCREEMFSLFQQARIEDLKLREEQLEMRFNDIRRSVEERIKEAELREEKLSSQQKSVEGILEKIGAEQKQLEPIQESIRESLKETGKKEADLESRSKELDRIQDWLEGRLEELDAKEQQFEERSKEVESRSLELDSFRRAEKERLRELDLKEKRLVERSRELDSFQKSNEKHAKELELKGKKLDSVKKSNEERAEQLDSKEKQLNSVREFITQSFKDFQSRNKQLKLDREKLELKHGKLVEKSKKLEQNQESLEQQAKELEVKQEQLAEKSMELEQNQESLEQQAKELEIKKKQLEEQREELELKEKQLTNIINSRVKVEQEEDMPPIIGSPVDIRFFVTMDGKNLQLFLNERSRDHRSMSEEVLKALQLSLDPAMLVLDAMEGFYPPHLRKGNVKFKASVVRSSCILLLEQLRRISPQIQSKVKERALKLAKEWKMRMNREGHKPLAVLGFLHLLASYNLISSFGADDLLTYLESVAKDGQVFELCLALGFADKVPDIIENFVKKKQYLVAVRFICGFDLVKKFPPVPLLKKHLKLSKKLARKILYTGKNMHQARNRAIDERVASIRAVIKCIVDFNLQWKYPPKGLEMSIENLLKEKARNRQIENASLFKNDRQDISKIELATVNCDPLHNKRPDPLPIPLITSKIELGTSNCDPLPDKGPDPLRGPLITIVTHILANMDGKNLLKFLGEHLAECGSLRNELSEALKMSFDPGKFILDAILELYPQHSKNAGIDMGKNVMRSFIFVLELLMGLSTEIKPQIKEAAMQLAVDWKAQITSEVPLDILGLLQLVCTYRLASGFDAAELYGLFCTVAQGRHVPELSEVLALSEKIPVSRILHFQDNINQSLSKSSPWYSLPHEKVPALFRFASDPAKLLLDAMQGCYCSNWEEKKGAKSGMGVLFHFLKQLVRVPVEIKTHVRAEAMRFAADWKAKLLAKTSKNSEVLCFLLFLAIYGLASSFDDKELLGLLDIVYKDGIATYLFHAFGLEERISEFIHNLIRKEQQPDAVRYIYAFDLVDKFPPIPLLKTHLACAEEAARKILEEGDHTSEPLNKSIKKELAALRAVIKCIQDHELESTYPSKDLRTRVVELERQKADQKMEASAPLFVSQPQELAEPERMRLPASMAAHQQEDADLFYYNPSFVMSHAQNQAGNKRPAPEVTSAPEWQQQQHAKRVCHASLLATSTSSPSIVSGNPIHPTQPLARHVEGFFGAPSASYLRAPAAYYGQDGFTSFPENRPSFMRQYESGPIVQPLLPFEGNTPNGFRSGLCMTPGAGPLYHPRPSNYYVPPDFRMHR